MKSYNWKLRKAQLVERTEPITETGCWIWMGGKYAGGYGAFNLDGQKDYAHRAAYRLFHGEIPEGKIVCHKCDVKACVNPAHLYLGDHHTNAMDIQRSVITGRFSAKK